MTRRIFGIIIIFISLLYLELTHNNYIDIILDDIILNTITVLTILILLTRIISKIYHMKLLKIEGFYTIDIFISNSKFIILILL